MERKGTRFSKTRGHVRYIMGRGGDLGGTQPKQLKESLQGSPKRGTKKNSATYGTQKGEAGSKWPHNGTGTASKTKIERKRTGLEATEGGGGNANRRDGILILSYRKKIRVKSGLEEGKRAQNKLLRERERDTFAGETDSPGGREVLRSVQK